MPASLVERPLGIRCTFSDGSRAELALRGLDGSPLARDLLVGLANLVHPHGSVDAASTAAQYVRAARDMVTSFVGRGFTGGAGELGRARLAEYWMGTTGPREACTRRMLVGFDAATGGLARDVRELAEGRAFNPQPFRRALPPYPEDEWARLAEVCTAVVEESFAAHREALAGAARGQDPAVDGWSLDNLRWLLSRRGPSTVVDVGAHLCVSAQTVRKRGGIAQATTGLFPHLEVTVAYLLAFGACSGVVPDGIGDLVVGDIDWAGDASVLLGYMKGRTGPESVTLGRRAVRLLEQWLSHSALLRSFAGPTVRRQLWLGVEREGSARISAGPVHRNVVRRWADSHELLRGEDGQRIEIHRHRIRTTHLSLRDRRAWAGNPRARVDPNHTPAVEGDHYLAATTPAQRQAVEAIVEDAQHDLLRRAQKPVVLTGNGTPAVGALPEQLGELGLDEAALGELLGGERDVFAAACADQLSGLHGRAGRPCPARPWVCLACPLAVFAPRHATNLLRLRAFFARQWRAMPAGQFMAVFGPYAHRLGQVLERYPPAVLTTAASAVADSDDELPLRPEELSS